MPRRPSSDQNRERPASRAHERPAIPGSLPDAVYQGNPPNCIRVTAHDVSGMFAVGPGILFENDDFKQVEFHPGFRRRLCGSPQMVKIAIAQCKRQLGIEKVVNA